ncbi:MAG: hypothetical protein CVU00_11890 [Bacteroidetes bacterium HGW-Bacteroidetes-17]|jgi:hypothetical protein|nr:MAG: hypothetical protein CVU00_11890 [Bacteroidetes bacterium HGW-Bacteroidetes-17]
MLTILLQQKSSLITDFGPMYHEFHADALIKEPWNAYSSIFFLVPVLFWAIKLRGHYRENWIIILLLPLLLLNGVGSTFYHAFRSSNFFLIMDFAPAMVMSLIIGAYLWAKVFEKWYWGLLMIVFAFFITRFFSGTLADSLKISRINISYLMNGTIFLAPALIILFKSNFYKWAYVIISIFLLIGAIIFRSLDYPTPNPFPEIMPQGTHFLWHIFTALAVFSMGYYFYYLKDLSFKSKQHISKKMH